jgi:hypothetical protein
MGRPPPEPYKYGCLELMFSVLYAPNSMIKINPTVGSGAITLTWSDARLPNAPRNSGGRRRTCWWRAKLFTSEPLRMG